MVDRPRRRRRGLPARPRPGRGAARDRRRLRGQGPLPPGRRDLRPAGLHPDGQQRWSRSTPASRPASPSTPWPRSAPSARSWTRQAHAGVRVEGPPRARVRARVARRGGAHLAGAVHPLQRGHRASPATTPSSRRRSTARCGSTWAPTCRTSARPPTGRIGVAVEMRQDDGEQHRRARPAVRRDRRAARRPRSIGSPRRWPGWRATRPSRRPSSGWCPIGLWLLVGRRRRTELCRRARPDWRARSHGGARWAAWCRALAGDAAVASASPSASRATCGCRCRTRCPTSPVPQDLQRWEIQGGLVTRTPDA